jgi:periplasmic protein CpxP/Spy
MSMKKLVLAAWLSGAMLTASAQESRQMPDPQVRAQRQTEALSRQLTLSADQKNRIQELYMVQAKTADSIRTEAAGNFQGLRGKIQAVQEATDQKIMGILDEGQKKQFEKYLEERKSRMQGARRGNNRK